MRGMNFPLDVVWIKDDKVTGCEQNIAIKDKKGEWSVIKSDREVNRVLEINAGKCKEFNIQEGDNLDMFL